MKARLEGDKDAQPLAAIRAFWLLALHAICVTPGETRRAAASPASNIMVGAVTVVIVSRWTAAAVHRGADGTPGTAITAVTFVNPSTQGSAFVLTFDFPFGLVMKFNREISQTCHETSSASAQFQFRRSAPRSE